jgi:small subunit ribosomal protein S1
MSNEESFEALFEESYTKMDAMEPGQQIQTEIVSISGGSIFIQLGGKSEGVLDLEEMTDKEGNVSVKEGDTITVYFLEAKNGEMRFTTRISGNKAGLAVLENAFKNQVPVEGVVEKEIKGGFEVKVGEARAFCPYSQMGAKRVEDASVYVGKHLVFKIIEHSENGRNILVSNRAILEEERKQQVEELKKTLTMNAVVKGTVKELRNFGAFVDLNGIQALLPISEISRERIEDISSALTIGQEIEAKIIKLDWDSERISLSMKALLADPWDTAKEKYAPGSEHKGTVVRVADFGAFVNLEPGLDGLIHVSELKGETRDNNPADLVKKGESLTVEINSVDTQRKRISLKPASAFKQDKAAQKYMEDDDTETYNPFADFFKK